MMVWLLARAHVDSLPTLSLRRHLVTLMCFQASSVSYSGTGEYLAVAHGDEVVIWHENTALAEPYCRFTVLGDSDALT